jgi:hypothetical protein
MVLGDGTMAEAEPAGKWLRRLDVPLGRSATCGFASLRLEHIRINKTRVPDQRRAENTENATCPTRPKWRSHFGLCRASQVLSHRRLMESEAPAEPKPESPARLGGSLALHAMCKDK